MLAANFVAELVITHAIPNFLLGRREGMAHIAGALENRRVDVEGGFR